MSPAAEAVICHLIDLCEDTYEVERYERKTKLLCENVFELSAMAEELQIIGSITVEDSRELFYLVLDWAEEFEKQFDPETQDYLTEMESFGRRKLFGAFQTESEPEPNISL